MDIFKRRDHPSVESPQLELIDGGLADFEKPKRRLGIVPGIPLTLDCIDGATGERNFYYKVEGREVQPLSPGGNKFNQEEKE